MLQAVIYIDLALVCGIFITGAFMLSRYAIESINLKNNKS
jgi:hypothetical protein